MTDLLFIKNLFIFSSKNYIIFKKIDKWLNKIKFYNINCNNVN